MKPASLRHTVTFTPQIETEDPEFGGPVLTDGPSFVMPAAMKTLRSGESVMQARLAGRVARIVTIRANQTSRGIDASYKMTDANAGITYNIKGIEETDDRRYLELLVEGGKVS